MGKGDNAKASFGFLDALLIVFIVLKLCGVINWSWWWVTAPLWIPIILILIILLGALIVCKIIDWFG